MTRTCQCCGRTWASIAEMRAECEHIGWMVDDVEAIELANCPCTATLVVSSIDACPPTLRDPGLPPTARDGCAGAAGDANSRE